MIFDILLSTQEWTDNGISWNPSDYKNISKLHLSNYELWKPELILHKYKLKLTT